MLFRTAKLSQLAEFDEIIDVRTPDEFAEDHIPGAINYPVLSNEERIQIGTLYKQVSPFEARKLGAVLVARNIAHHIETHFRAHPKSWRPLIYCWRGGQRSGAMSIVLAQIGWAAHKLEGGYKTYRHNVLDELESLPATLRLRVICGATGSGKSRLLDALAHSGAQVLDLEALAQHRGSVLGGLPQQAQPSQKWFESQLLLALQKFDSTCVVYAEAESNKIGSIKVPSALTAIMHKSDCVQLETAPEARIAVLLEDYRHFIEQPEQLIAQLQGLHPFHGSDRLANWTALIRAGEFAELVGELLALHYDPSYLRALSKHFQRLGQAKHIDLIDLSAEKLAQVAAALQHEA